jgi:hypothetical protein
MAFKMKGYQAHSKSPMQKGGIWETVKSKAKQAKNYIKENMPSTVNMSNVVGLTGQDKKDWDAKNRREAIAHAKWKENKEKEAKYQAAKSKEKEGYKSQYQTPKYEDTWVAKKEQEYADKGGYAQYAKDQKRNRGSFAQEYADRFTNKKNQLAEEYAEGEYQKAKSARNKDLNSQTPKTEAQMAEQKKKQKPVPFAKKKKYK